MTINKDIKNQSNQSNELNYCSNVELAAAFNIDIALLIDPILLATHLHKQAGLSVASAAKLCKVSRTYIYKKLKETE